MSTGPGRDRVTTLLAIVPRPGDTVALFGSRRAISMLKVKAPIPEKSIGRLLDSLVDVIRPFTERRGLKADLIRLQREEVALEVARLARSQLDESHAPINAVPIKGLIPLLEKASLEEPNNKDMIDRWANLLAHAATDRGVSSALFSNILSQMNGTQAKLLEEIADLPPDWPLSPWAVAPVLTAQTIEAALVSEASFPSVGIPKNERDAAERIARLLSMPGISLVLMAVYKDWGKGTEPFTDFREIVRSQVPRERILDVAVLKSLYLLEVEQIDLKSSGFTYQGEWVNITRLGRELFVRTRPLTSTDIKGDEDRRSANGQPSKVKRKKSQRRT